MKASKNNVSNLNALNDKFKDIESLRNNPNKDFAKNSIESNKPRGSEGQTIQEGMRATKNNSSNLNSSGDNFKDIESPRNNPNNKDFNKDNGSNLNTSENKFKDIGDTRNSINKNNIDSAGIGNTKENINTKDIKSNTEDKTNVVTNNKGKDVSNGSTNDNNSENKNGGGKEVKGKMEDRTIGQYMKDKVQGSRFVDNINRAYSLGYNTTSKWDVKNRNKDKKGRKK